MSDQEQEDIQADHLDGLHFGAPDPYCWICEIDDKEPEAPGG